VTWNEILRCAQDDNQTFGESLRMLAYQNRFCILICFLGIIMTGCRATGSGPASQEPSTTELSSPATLTVFAAASLAEAMGEIAAQFEAAHPGVEVSLNLAGSQQLVQQLGSGAAADVFASANAEQMQAAEKTGRVQAGAASEFVRNRLVVVAPPDNPAGINSLEDLARPGVRVVLAAKEVPAGKYSLEFLQRASQEGSLGSDYERRVLANVVSYEESVRFALAKVLLGEADAGIVYTSDAAQEDGDKLRKIEIPQAINPVAVYLIAPLSDASQPELAQAFVDLVLSAEGQAVLAKYGFNPVNQ